jgi:hypothetical protein
VEPARRKERKTQDYVAKHSDDGSRTSSEELVGNKICRQKQDPMTRFHKGPMSLPGVKGHYYSRLADVLDDCLKVNRN